MIDLGTPARGLAFIRHIQTSENYANSPIVITPKTRYAIAKCQFIVVAVGGCEICEDEDCERYHYAISTFSENGPSMHPHSVEVGDWVLVRNRAWMASPDPGVFVCRVDDVLGKFVES